MQVVLIGVLMSGSDPALLDRLLLQGTWQVEKAEVFGMPFDGARGWTLTFTRDRVVFTRGEDESGWTSYRLAAGKTPRRLDLFEGDTLDSRGISEVRGDTLRVSFGLTHHQDTTDADGRKVKRTTAGGPPPDFGSGGGLFVLKRKK